MMPKLTITIDCSSAAFWREHDGQIDLIEVADTLRRYLMRVETCTEFGERHPIKDTQGQQVGDFVFSS